MSALSDRTIEKLISRPNGRSALRRIFEELSTLIDRCPKENTTHEIEIAFDRAMLGVEAVLQLYKGKRNAPTNP